MKIQDPDFEQRHEEIQEILGIVPPWVIRWGSLALAVVLALLLAGTVWFKYPDRISCHLTLTSENPPVVLNARQNGRIELLAVTDGSKVKKGQLLAVLESSARFADLLKVDTLITFCRSLPGNPDSAGFTIFQTKEYQLGEWQPSFAALVKARRDISDFRRQGSNSAKIKSLLKQQKDYNSLLDRQYRQLQIRSEEMVIQERQYQRLIALKDSNAISLKEFETGVTLYLKAKYDMESDGSMLAQTQIEIDQLNHEIILVEKNYLEVRDQKINFMRQAYEQMSGTLSEWKLNYAFIAPIDGIVTFTRVWSQNQFVKQGERVLTIISGEMGPVVGRVLLPLQGAGKVRIGQKVIVRIDRYPYMEYGSLQGRVESFSLVADQDFYSLEVSFPKGLKTTYKKELKLSQGMTGQSEIITDELSFLVRIVNPIRSILKRNEALKN